METKAKIYTKNEYKSSLHPIWCPGCGDYGVLKSFYTAFSELNIPPENLVVVSGIGCSSRIPGYVNSYGFNAVHGRALPIATGVKLSNPKLTVVAAGGDGDGLSIGGGHFPHAARRNVDITYVMMDNSIYGLTKGQLSPTSIYGDITATSSYGSIDVPLNPVTLAIAYNATFVARSISLDPKHLAEMIKRGIQHKGFSFIHTISPCITYRGKDEFTRVRESVSYLDGEHDPTDRDAAFRIAESNGKLIAGVIYENRQPTYEERFEEIREKARKENYSIEDIMDKFLPRSPGDDRTEAIVG